MPEYYYYTKWRFKPEAKPEDLDYGEVFHTTLVSSSPPKEFLAETRIDDLDEFFIKQFDSRKKMEAYWLDVTRTNFS